MLQTMQDTTPSSSAKKTHVTLGQRSSVWGLRYGCGATQTCAMVKRKSGCRSEEKKINKHQTYLIQS